MSDVGDAIRRARERRGLTMQQLANLAGKNLSTISRIERGVTDTPSSLADLQRVLEIGIYAPPEPKPEPEPPGVTDPPLSQATFAELLDALRSRHGHDVRAARVMGVRIGETIDELPPEVAALPRDEIVGEWDADGDDTESGGA